MPNEIDDKIYLGVPGWLWEKLLHYIFMSTLAYFGYAANSKLQVNGEAQTKHAAELKKEVAMVGEKVDQNTTETAQVKAATQAIPVAAAEAAKVVIEQKEAGEKPPE
jgi:hypothetical protein